MKTLIPVFILVLTNIAGNSGSLQCYSGDYALSQSLNITTCDRKSQMCFTAIPNNPKSRVSYQGCTGFIFGKEEHYIYKDRLNVGLVTYAVCKSNLCNNFDVYKELSERAYKSDIPWLEDVLSENSLTEYQSNICNKNIFSIHVHLLLLTIWYV